MTSKTRKFRISPAMILAIVALFVALSAERTRWPYNPISATPAGLHRHRLGCSAFARHY